MNDIYPAIWNVQYIPWNIHRVLFCFMLLSFVTLLRPRHSGCLFTDIFECIFLNENVWISIKTSQNFVPKGMINNVPALVQIMAWHRPGDKPLFIPMMVRLLLHICVTGPQWVNSLAPLRCSYNLKSPTVISKLKPRVDILSISDQLPSGKCHKTSALVQIMDWCHHATSHYLNQCWPSSITPHGITRPQCVDEFVCHTVCSTSIMAILRLSQFLWSKNG